MTGEDRRQLLHASMTGWLLLLRWLPPWGAAAMAGAAALGACLLLPALGWDRGIRREGAPWLDGVKLYPLAVLALVLLFPLPVAAAAWAVLGIGDAASNVAGRRFGRPGFCGRGDRSLAGTLAFVVTALPAAVAAHAWVAREWPDERIVAAGAAAAGAGALVEMLIPRGWDDNFAIAIAAAAAFVAVT